MKKQLHKIKIAAENFSRPAKLDKNSEELLTADKQVEKYKDVLEKISKKFTLNPSSSTNASAEPDANAREKRAKKVHEYRLAQAMEESVKELPDGLLKEVLDNCSKLEKNIATQIINNEIDVEMDVTKNLNLIMDNHISTIQKQKRIVTKLMQDNDSAKHKYQAAVRVNENQLKINQLREEQEECETKLEKERDVWAAEMFELIAEEENMANYIINYIKYQQLYYQSALNEIEDVMDNVNKLLKDNNKRIFKIPLEEHLAVTKRTISYVIELCVCCLLEKGLYEEGLLRVGCAGTKLRRFRSAIDANFIGAPFPIEYQDVHVIASVLKSYLRDLPDPLLTYRLYDEFISIAQRPNDDKRKTALLNAINQLPTGHYFNLRYLTKFLSMLAQRSQHNKMSSQNIAIVIAPNLLWPPDSIDIDAVQKVNSSAYSSTIVELLVSDWSYFFDGDVEFYQTMTRDDLFPDNGGFSYDREPGGGGGGGGAVSMTATDSMTKSMHVAGSTADRPNNYQTHSRSSSHDTSQILLSTAAGVSDSIKRSQSSSSLSDSSPPQSNSPKLPIRRKHNKQAAPTPPADITKYHSNHHHSHHHHHHPTTTVVKQILLKNCSDNDDDDSNQMSLYRQPLSNTKSDMSSQTPGLIKPMIKQFGGSNDHLIGKPEKPPRPAFISTECQTLNRHSYRSKVPPGTIPIVMPRNILNVTKSNENLATSGGGGVDDDSPTVNVFGESNVVLRDKTGGDAADKPDKPAIPERPATLMRPASFKGMTAAQQQQQQQDNNHQNPYHHHHHHQNQHHHQNYPNNFDTNMRKNSNFRSTGSVQKSTINGSNGGGGGGSNSAANSLTTLERTHIYNVDKKQVAIIDVIGGNGGSVEKKSEQIVSNSLISPTTPSLNIPTVDNAIIDDKLMTTTVDSNLNVNTNLGSFESSTAAAAAAADGIIAINTTAVPPSPRGFDPKIKRPQIPAPPPPTNRPKSGDGTLTTASDSTNL